MFAAERRGQEAVATFRDNNASAVCLHVAGVRPKSLRLSRPGLLPQSSVDQESVSRSTREPRAMRTSCPSSLRDGEK